MHSFNLLLYQPLTAAFQCHTTLKRFPLLSNRNPFAAVGPFGSTNLKQISLRSVVHSVTWLMSSLYYIIFLIMYEFFCSNAVQASLMSLVGWSSDSPPKKRTWMLCNHFIKLSTYKRVFCLCNISFTLFWPCFHHHLFLTCPLLRVWRCHCSWS